MGEKEGSGIPFVSCIVLGAGEATRMGHPKQVLPLNGRTLVECVVSEALASSAAETILVLGSAAEQISSVIGSRPKLKLIFNPRYAEGQSTSLQSGLSSVSDDSQAAAVLLADQPGVTAEMINTVIQELLTRGCIAARPVFERGGRLIPSHPVVLARKIWPEVFKLAGDAGARTLFARHPDWLFEVKMPGDPPLDIDTWEDYAAAMRAQPGK